MSRWKFSLILTLVMVLGAFGCGSSSSSGISVAISPLSTSVVTNTTAQFSALVTGTSTTTVTWALTCATNVAANTCGTINTNGLYTAPATLPTVTSNGTTSASPAVTITATSQADSTKYATATLTIITGISIFITPNAAVVGTGEFYTFQATVTNPGCNIISNPTCLNVTWSLSTTLTGVGTINPTTGVYTAPTPVPSPSSVTITATSVADTSVTATATVNIVTASPPTVSAVSPNTTALGGLFQDFYITGTNFISTNVVFANGVPLDPSTIATDSSSLIRARIPDYMLASPPQSGIFQISVSQQVGTPQTCPDASQCQIAVTAARPAVVGPSPDSVSQQGTSGVVSFNIDGGFFGTASNPAVSATYNGQLRGIQLAASGSTGSTRQMSVTIGGNSGSSDLTTPGLYPIAVRNASNPSKFAVTNLAVQPNYSNLSGPTSTITTIASRIAVGTSPNDVAINPATDLAVVANTGTNNISLIDLTASPPAVVANICTAAVGAVAPCPSSGPTSVAVDYVRNIALVVNSTTQTIAEVDLNNRAVSFVTSPLQNTPGAVGINPVTGRALVAMQQQGYGVIMDLTQSPPVFAGVVSISTGPATRVAVEPHLNWAIATPGGSGSIGIVDLSRQTVNNIVNVSRTTNVVTVTVQQSTTAAVQPPLAVKPNDAVLIQGVSVAGDTTSFNGIYTVTSQGPGGLQFTYTETGAALPDVPLTTTVGTVNYSEPVATNSISISDQGIGINTETQQAVIVDPGANGLVSFFSLIDQSVSGIQLMTNGSNEPTGPIAAQYNPLTNTVVAVNFYSNTLSVIDPTKPVRLNNSNLYSTQPGPIALAIDPGTNTAVIANQTDNSVTVVSLGTIQPLSITETSPQTFVANSSLTSAPAPSAVTLTVLGTGFASGSLVRLDGTGLQTTFVSNRKLTAIVPPSLLSSARRFALDVQNSGGAITNAEDFTVEQSVDVTGCSATPYPSGVAIDPQQNLAAVSLFGCNSLALINLSTGTGQSVSVGSNPLGVGVFPRLHLAVVANNGDGTASVVDELGTTVTSTPSTGAGSMGVAVDQDSGEAAIANSVANTVTVVNVVTSATNSISTGARPVAVAFNYQDHQVAIASAGSNNISFADASSSSATQTFGVTLPTSVVYDPVASDCNQFNTSSNATNTVGCFVVNSSLFNDVEIIDPISSLETAFRIGINPTAIAYNFLTSTLVSTNTASRTVTVADFLAQRIRAVLPLPPGPVSSNLALTGLAQFALDIHPFTNLAVIADTANGRVLFVPLPR